MINKFEWIDAVRGYAVLGVVAVHSLMGEKGIFLSGFIGIGAKGVQLFYIVSAFTLLLSHSNRKDEINPNLNFFVRRFFRIAPMFYLSIFFWLFFTYSINYPISSYKHIGNYSIISHFMFLHGLSPFWQDSLVPGGWSVGVEYIFYALCPYFFSKIITLKKSIIYYVSSVYLASIAIFYLKLNPLIPYKETWDGYLYGFFPAQANVFLAGFILYYIRNISAKLQLIELFKVCLYILPLIIIGIVCNMESGLEINILVTFVFIVFIIVVKSNKYRFLSPNFLQYLGKLSYSIYIVHFMVLFFLEKYNLIHFVTNLTMNYLIRFSIILISSAVISHFTYKYIEQLFLSFGKILLKKIEKKSYENMLNIRS